MAWAWAVVLIIAVGLPVTAWGVTRKMKAPKQVMGGPGPRFERVDNWLYSKYRFGTMDRWRIRDAVLAGQELHEPPLREAAHSLAAAMLAGEVGTLYQRIGWIRTCSGLAVMVAAVVAAVMKDDYVIIAAGLAGLPQLGLGWQHQRTVRRHVEQACRLNE
jgi:hypothetical protein